MIPNINHFTPQQETGTKSTNFYYFFLNHPHTRKLLWIKACAGFLIGMRAKENCCVTVNSKQTNLLAEETKQGGRLAVKPITSHAGSLACEPMGGSTGGW